MSIEYKGIVWLGVYVEDFEKAVDFYENTLELPLTRKKNGCAHFDAGSGALLEVFSGGKKHNAPKVPNIQSTMAALEVSDLAKTKAALVAKGVEFTENEGSFENMHWATFVDPEGNCIEIKEFG